MQTLHSLEQKLVKGHSVEVLLPIRVNIEANGDTSTIKKRHMYIDFSKMKELFVDNV